MYQYKQLMVAVVAIRSSLWWCEAYGPLCLVRWLCRSMCEMPTTMPLDGFEKMVLIMFGDWLPYARACLKITVVSVRGWFWLCCIIMCVWFVFFLRYMVHTRNLATCLCEIPHFSVRLNSNLSLSTKSFLFICITLPRDSPLACLC